MQCLFATDQYICYGIQTQRILKTEGVDAAIRYVRSVILVNHGYNLAHILMHAVGEATYYKENRDIGKTVAYLKPHLTSIDDREAFINGYDGFYHGAISAYFADRLHEESLPKLISNICGGSIIVPGITSHSFVCYHAVGHGVMHALGNKLGEAIKVCAELDNELAQQGCYFGIFMEESFLYAPIYHKGAARPDVKGSSLLSVCKPLTGAKVEYCTFFVGQVYLTTHPSDLRGAFKECKKLKNFVRPCMMRLAFAYIPQIDPGDYNKLIQICDYAGTEYRSECISYMNQELQTGMRKTTKKPIWMQFINFLRNTNREAPSQ